MKQRISKWVADRQTGISKRMRGSQFNELTVLPGDVVFLGDSITEGGEWHEWFSGVSVRNRGIGGDTTGEVLARLGSATTYGAAAIFLLIGTNDVTLSVPRDEIVANVRSILRGLRAVSDETPVFLQSVMPRQKRLCGRVRELNRDLERVAAEEGAAWIDLWPALSTSDGALNPDFSWDGIHLNGLGYATWARVLHPQIDSVTPGYAG
ncbi:GDSL-type esterase/lipase family protein [Arthrobacter sp. HS15c]|uniref:GDSL-type esterase/lipase family protein n=1 Tax=Arthrobacter sp. HS15c TaxID=3230279 RepID=UPI00346567C1